MDKSVLPGVVRPPVTAVMSGDKEEDVFNADVVGVFSCVEYDTVVDFGMYVEFSESTGEVMLSDLVSVIYDVTVAADVDVVVVVLVVVVVDILKVVLGVVVVVVVVVVVSSWILHLSAIDLYSCSVRFWLNETFTSIW